jgi:hypothetical protein
MVWSHRRLYCLDELHHLLCVDHLGGRQMNGAFVVLIQHDDFGNKLRAVLRL